MIEGHGIVGFWNQHYKCIIKRNQHVSYGFGIFIHPQKIIPYKFETSEIKFSCDPIYPRAIISMKYLQYPHQKKNCNFFHQVLISF
jgi:hypothetical protein